MSDARALIINHGTPPQHVAPIVPPDTARAAWTAFLRTTAQAYAATLPAGGLSAGMILELVRTPDPALLWATIGAAVLSPPLAGAVAALQMIARGIPGNYTGAGTE